MLSDRVRLDYKWDLEEVGCPDVWAHLSLVQERRNRFAHGQPQAIDDALVRAVVEKLKLEHRSMDRCLQ